MSALGAASRLAFVRLEGAKPPSKVVRPNRKRQCERFLANDELSRLGQELARLRSSHDLTSQSAGAAITLLLLTGCRKGEILSLEWSDVKGRRLLLRDSKTGPRTVWLGSSAREVIAGIPRHPKLRQVFWNYRYRKPMRDITSYWIAAREAAGLQGVRLHDLRHTFASHAAMKKETLPMIGRLLGHSCVGSTARYAHLDDEHVLDAAEQIGSIVERMLLA